MEQRLSRRLRTLNSVVRFNKSKKTKFSFLSLLLLLLFHWIQWRVLITNIFFISLTTMKGPTREIQVYLTFGDFLSCSEREKKNERRWNWYSHWSQASQTFSTYRERTLRIFSHKTQHTDSVYFKILKIEWLNQHVILGRFGDGQRRCFYIWTMGAVEHRLFGWFRNILDEMRSV